MQFAKLTGKNILHKGIVINKIFKNTQTTSALDLESCRCCSQFLTSPSEERRKSSHVSYPSLKLSSLDQDQDIAGEFETEGSHFSENNNREVEDEDLSECNFSSLSSSCLSLVNVSEFSSTSSSKTTIMSLKNFDVLTKVQ